MSPLPHAASFGAQAAMVAGVAVTSASTGIGYPEFGFHQPATAIPDLIEAVQPVGLMGIGSFVRRMVQDGASGERDFSSLRIIQLAGEVMTARMMHHLRDTLARCGATDVHITTNYGCTETAVGWVQGYDGGPLYCTAPDQVMLEVVDPDTHVSLPDGQTGLLLLTHLNRRGMPLLRYAIGDLAAITHDRCPYTGWQGEAIIVSSGSAHVTRTAELLNIKGTLVNPQIIHHVVMNYPSVLEYRIILCHQVPDDLLSGDVLRIDVGLEDGIDWETWSAEQCPKLIDQVRQASEITPEVRTVPLSDIYNPAAEFKARRVLDTRDLT
jgi:phenylacetate-CoA ligase